MESPYLNFISLTWPFILGIILLSSLFFLPKDHRLQEAQTGKEATTQISGDLLGLLSFKWLVKRKFITRIIIIIIALSLFAKPAFVDYSAYFPSSYFMDVYFDNEGILQALNDFTKEEIESMNISKDWKNKKDNYFQKINNYLLNIAKIKNFFDPSGKYIHSNGECTLISEKVKGWQQYYIVKSYGFLDHCVEIPNECMKKIKSEFFLADTKDNYINLTLSDIYLKYTKIIRPQYNQKISTMVGDQNRTYNHSLINVNKLTFLPIIKISKTIYFIDDDDGIHLVPIGYAIYRPK